MGTSKYVEKFVSLFASLVLILVQLHIKIGCKSETKGGCVMQKEQIYDMMNGFLVEGMLSLPEGIAIEDEFRQNGGYYAKTKNIIRRKESGQQPPYRTEKTAESIPA